MALAIQKKNNLVVDASREAFDWIATRDLVTTTICYRRSHGRHWRGHGRHWLSHWLNVRGGWRRCDGHWLSNCLHNRLLLNHRLLHLHHHRVKIWPNDSFLASGAWRHLPM